MARQRPRRLGPGHLHRLTHEPPTEKTPRQPDPRHRLEHDGRCAGRTHAPAIGNIGDRFHFRGIQLSGASWGRRNGHRWIGLPVRANRHMGRGRNHQDRHQGRRGLCGRQGLERVQQGTQPRSHRLVPGLAGNQRHGQRRGRRVVAGTQNLHRTGMEAGRQQRWQLPGSDHSHRASGHRQGDCRHRVADHQGRLGQACPGWLRDDSCDALSGQPDRGTQRREQWGQR